MFGYLHTLFPLSTDLATSLTDIGTDLVAWGAALIVIPLTVLAYRKVKSIIR